MYLGRDRVTWAGRSSTRRASIRPQMYLGRDTTRRERFSPTGSMLQFGPRCIWGETAPAAGNTVSVTMLQFGPRCIWGETGACSRRTNSRSPLQFGPRCIWGETCHVIVRRLSAQNASIRPQMYLGRDEILAYRLSSQRTGFNSAPDVSGERRSLRSFLRMPAYSLQFGPRCIWGETRTLPGAVMPRAGASIRPQMYLGRDLKTSWCETLRLTSFNSAPDVSGERLDSPLSLIRDNRASIRPQMYLGRDRTSTA